MSNGGGKEGQEPGQKESKGNDEGPEVVAVTEGKPDDDKLFTFACTLHLSLKVNSPHVAGTSFSACIDSGATSHYCPAKSRFITYKPITSRNIVAADGCTVYASETSLHVVSSSPVLDTTEEVSNIVFLNKIYNSKSYSSFSR